MLNGVNKSNKATLYIRYFMRERLLKIILYDNSKKIIFSGKACNLWLHEGKRQDINRLSEEIVSILLKHNIKTIRVYLRGRSTSQKTILKIINQSNIEVLWIKDVTDIFNNGAYKWSFELKKKKN